jgi:hypothetical protein
MINSIDQLTYSKDGFPLNDLILLPSKAKTTPSSNFNQDNASPQHLCLTNTMEDNASKASFKSPMAEEHLGSESVENGSSHLHASKTQMTKRFTFTSLFALFVAGTAGVRFLLWQYFEAL